MNIFLVVNGVFTLFLGIVWNKSDLINTMLKFILIVLGIGSFVFLAIDAGWIVKG